jgi:hypothetical protein
MVGDLVALGGLLFASFFLRGNHETAISDWLAGRRTEMPVNH